MIDTLGRRIEEKLNSLEIGASNLQTNIEYARSELLRKVEEIKKSKTTLYFIIGYTKEIGIWELEIYKDKSEAECQFNNYVEDYNAELAEDTEWYALCPDGIGRFYIEERTI